MNVSKAISGFLSHIKDNTLSHFDLLDVFVYDEGLDFRGRASQYIAREGVFQQMEGSSPNDWVFIIWNRSGLTSNDTSHNRILEVTIGQIDPNIIDTSVTMRMAKVDVEIKVVTNNIELAENIEEWLHVLNGETIAFSADYGAPFDVMECSAEADSTTSFDKEDLNEVGSVISIGLSSTISFPVFLDPKQAKIIKHIHNKIYDALYVDYSAPILSDEWIPDAP